MTVQHHVTANARAAMENDGVEVLILTAEQRRDLVRALTIAVDTELEATDRWVALINLIQTGAPL